MRFPSESEHTSWVSGRGPLAPQQLDALPPPQGDASGASQQPWDGHRDGRWDAPSTTPQTVGLRTPLRRSSLLTPSTPWVPMLSFGVSLALYALVFGWQLGLGLTLLLLVHELGHFVLIRSKGLPAALPVFIPFIGAYVAMRRLPASVRDEAEIALAGPLAGCLSAIVCLGLYEATSLRLFLSLAYLGYVLNLLNLLPLPPLDGGRIIGALSRWFWLLAFAAAIGYALATKNELLLVITALAAFQTVQYVGRRPWRSPYYRISLLARVYVTVVYLGLALVLAVGMVVTHHTLVLARPF